MTDQGETQAQWPKGLLTPLLTPLRDDELDLTALEQLVRFQIDSGAAGLIVCGGTGEFGVLTLDERRRLAAEVVSVADGRLPVIVGTGALATRDAVELSVHAREVGAAGLLLASPFGEPISWSERLRFYEEVEASASLPTMVYNTECAGFLSLPEVERLTSLPNVTAIKNNSGDATFLGDLLAWGVESGVAVYVGLDNMLRYGAENGSHGAVSGLSNLVPEQIVRTLELASGNDAAGELERTWPTLREFIRMVEESPNYVALCKAGMIHRGIDAGAVRRPFLPPSADELKQMRTRLASLDEAFAVRSPLSALGQTG